MNINARETLVAIVCNHDHEGIFRKSMHFPSIDVECVVASVRNPRGDLSMKMNHLAFLAPMLALTVGCRTVTKKDMMVTSAKIKAESHEVWNRPTELGYTVGDYIEGTSETKKMLGFFRVGGDATASGISIPTFGSAAASLSANAKWAVSNAVDDSNADGIYITKVVEEKTIIFPIWTTKATVRGKALKLKDFGPIDKSRADLDRLGYPPAKK